MDGDTKQLENSFLASVAYNTSDSFTSSSRTWRRDAALRFGATAPPVFRNRSIGSRVVLH